jgi:replicative DNA helicase
MAARDYTLAPSVLHPALPAAIESEKATLGSVLLNRDALIPIASWLLPDDYHYERHALIFDAMLACWRRRVPPDTRTVAEELRKRGQLDAVGGVEYLSMLVDVPATSYHVEHYAADVAYAAIRRRLIDAGGQIAALGYNEQGDLETLIAEAQALVVSVTQRMGTRKGGLTPLTDVMGELYDFFATDQTPAIETGLRDYDTLTGGLWPGDLIVPAGRPGHGKSAFVKTLAVNVARVGHPVALFSLEMQRKKVALNILAMESGIDGMALKTRRIDEDELSRALTAMGEANWPLYLEDVRVSMAEIRTRCLRHVAEHGPLAVVIVDYLQLVKPASIKAPRELQVSEIARGLKELAMELSCTVIAPAQLNRAIEGRPDSTPTLADLRESGEIEQAADQVAFIVRPEKFDPETDQKGIGILHVVKHRDGQPGAIPLRFDGPRTCFADLTYRTPEGY